MFNKLSQIFVFAVLLNVFAEIHAQKKIVCYYGSWAVYRPGAGKYSIEDINPNLCTHLVYGFAGVETNGNIKVLDPWNDIDLQGYIRFNRLKQQNPSLKTLIAVGGWNEGSPKYSVIAANAQYRQNFVNSAINLMNQYNFDGLDLDWEYPAQRGGALADKVNFVILLEDFRKAFGTRYLLTIAVGATAQMIEISYNVPRISNAVDFINVMTYDLRGAFDPVTGANAGLYSSSPSDYLTVSYCISSWISQGAPLNKIIMGIPIYGRSFTLQSSSQNYVGAPAVGPGHAGPYTQEPGMLGYNEICELLQSNQWTLKWDDVQKVPYMYNGNQWVSYDNQLSVTEKVKFINSRGLGGAMVWSIETDPLTIAGCPRNPILNTIKQNLA
ncbi:hypothetical protein FQR65_LT05403 [Abscondita terminalis]|nr:hypothetical protein FQR65_LT05403 [Abscondita terminalis]